MTGLIARTNANRWFGNEKPFSSKERRILLRYWMGRAYKTYGPKYDDMRKNVFQKTGCLLTADVSDRLVQPEKLPDYQLPPVSILNPASKAPISNEITPSTGVEETENIRRTSSSWIIMKLVLNYPKKETLWFI